MVYRRIEPTPAEQLNALCKTRDRYAALAEKLRENSDPLLDPDTKLAEERNARRIAHAYEKSVANSIARMSDMGKTRQFALPSFRTRTWLIFFIAISAVQSALLLAYFRPAIFQVGPAAPRPPIHRPDRVASLPPKPVMQPEAPPPIAVMPKPAQQIVPPPLAAAPKPAQQKAPPPVAIILKPLTQAQAPPPVAAAPKPSAQPSSPPPIAIAPQRGTPPVAPPPVAAAPQPSTPPVTSPQVAAAPQPGTPPVTPPQVAAAPQPSTPPVTSPQVAAAPVAAASQPGAQPATPPPIATFVLAPAAPQAAVSVQPPTRLEAVKQTHSLPPYPAVARTLGEEGTTQMRVAISTQGTVTDCEIANGSGSARLDAAACSYVQGHWRWISPTRNGQPVTANAEVSIVWSLKTAR